LVTKFFDIKPIAYVVDAKQEQKVLYFQLSLHNPTSKIMEFIVKWLNIKID